MTYVSIYLTMREADVAMWNFWHDFEHKEPKPICNRQHHYIEIGDNRYYFISEALYTPKYWLGKTYVINGKMYHSGYEVKDAEKN